ncbi:FKBP-type peptidyl-prolyl cis-trans isomerase [Mucilaginibacter glaciei]|uniref:Peptidyl-prolyl cis-trans isomerase n=1 Tax=Mucilaginibacter glaciei TaxID=2772109 RepID=A0A926NUD8_9SPHI|nr:FKBP-type peptidyl-prolyl cis-trans isomerase [Mucilaginibacter glaciei]MBD1394185.1 FKBP-type peptidyl-prolyl cis-trans isomerase [Mucilaginibacter glaciei]
MRKNLMFIALATIGLASCKGGFKKGDGGMLYNIHVDKPGTNLQAGDFISLNLTLKNEADSVLGSTYDLGHPINNIMQKPQAKGDISAAFLMLSEGDSATIKLSIDTMFKKGTPRPPGMKGKYIIYEVKVEKVIPKGTQTDAVFQAKVADYFKVQAEAVKKAEPAKIEKFLAEKSLKPTKTASGLLYVITKTGSGATPVNGDTAVVNYTGKLLNGKFFDSSLKEEAVKAKQPMDPRRTFAPIRIAVGEGKVIKGWDEGLLLLNKGAKATFVIPSSLGWGEQGFPPAIGPYTPVWFEVELVDIVKPNPNAPKPPVMPAVK